MYACAACSCIERQCIINWTHGHRNRSVPLMHVSNTRQFSLSFPLILKTNNHIHMTFFQVLWVMQVLNIFCLINLLYNSILGVVLVKKILLHFQIFIFENGMFIEIAKKIADYFAPFEYAYFYASNITFIELFILFQIFSGNFIYIQ